MSVPTVNIPRLGQLDICRLCRRTIMWTTYNSKQRWCHVPLLRVRCSDTEAEPVEKGIPSAAPAAGEVEAKVKRIGEVFDEAARRNRK